MKRFISGLTLSALLFLGMHGTAQADSFLEIIKDIEIHGFASSSYTYNFNEPVTNKNGNRIFDTDHNSFKFDVGELVLMRETPNPGEIGFRTDLTYGFSLPEAAKSSPGPSTTFFTPATGVVTSDVDDDDFDVQQAYVSYNAPIGSGVQLDFGKFITHIGAEVIEGYDGWNNNFSRSFLFGLTIPFTHTGVRASYTINDMFSVMAMIANGWDNTEDNNDGKTFGVQIGVTPLDNISLLLNWVGGPEQDSSADWRNVFDIVLDIAITERLLVQLNFVHGFEDAVSFTSVTSGAVKTRDVDWTGFGVIVRQDVNKWFSLNLRGEWFDDDDGTRAGDLTVNPAGFPEGQELWEITVTPEVRINQNMVVRFEYRHDESDKKVFINEHGSFYESQDTVALNALFHF